MEDETDQTKTAREAQAGGWSSPRLQTSEFSPAQEQATPLVRRYGTTASYRLRRHTTMFVTPNEARLICIDFHTLAFFLPRVPSWNASKRASLCQTLAHRLSAMPGKGGTYIIHTESLRAGTAAYTSEKIRKTR